ncbi:hypothetical protein [Phenylobacterium sp.]|uniref:hypothetical protein n=1 Tax=Phenylobacterium sp. TaxID=1871053 RepID=UPI002736A121|nr:hypothetical protein [Phenylobacterium sp.]MDP3592580.1 hypothetical protein [Phenylobacterium sp.]
MPDPEILPDPNEDNPPRPELPDEAPDGDIPELPGPRDPLGNDVTDGPDGLDIGPQ